MERNESKREERKHKTAKWAHTKHYEHAQSTMRKENICRNGSTNNNEDNVIHTLNFIFTYGCRLLIITFENEKQVSWIVLCAHTAYCRSTIDAFVISIACPDFSNFLLSRDEILFWIVCMLHSYYSLLILISLHFFSS